MASAQKVQTIDMTRGNTLSQVSRFAGVLILGNLLQQLYSMVDAAVVGSYIGTNALAAVSCSSWVIWMVLAVSRDCGNAVSICASVEVGKGDKEQLRRVAANAYLMGIGAAAIMTALLLGGLDVILRLLNVPGEIYVQARQYLLLFALAVPFIVVFQIGGALLRAIGNGKVTSLALTASTVMNIVLDLVFVLVLEWSVAGAAAATLLAHAVTAAVAAVNVAKVEEFRPGKGFWRPDGAILREFRRLCLPMFLNSAVIAAGGLLVQSKVNGVGAYFAAGTSAGTKLFKLLEAAIIAIQTAASVYIGQNLGAKQPERIRRGLRSIVLGALGFTAAVAVVSWIFDGAIINCFLSKDDPALYEKAFAAAQTYMRLMMSCSLIAAPMYIYRAAVQALGHPVFSMYSGVLQLFVRIFCVFVLPMYLGDFAYFLPTPLAWLVSLPTVMLPCLYYIRKNVREHEASAKV